MSEVRLQNGCVNLMAWSSSTFFLTLMRSIFLGMYGERDKMLDILTIVKLASEDGVVTYDEIRENLRK